MFVVQPATICVAAYNTTSVRCSSKCTPAAQGHVRLIGLCVRGHGSTAARYEDARWKAKDDDDRVEKKHGPGRGNEDACLAGTVCGSVLYSYSTIRAAQHYFFAATTRSQEEEIKHS